MITLVHVNEADKISNMSQEVQEVVVNILQILDDAYGVTRDIKSMGGYVAIIEDKEDLNKFSENVAEDSQDLAYRSIEVLKSIDRFKI